MTRPLVDASLSVRPCKFYASADSRTFPRVQVDRGDKEQPCSPGLVEGDPVPESLAMGFVGTAVCALQRKCGVCPRGLGEIVPPDLVPFGLRK